MLSGLRDALSRLLADRWQIPLALVAAAAGGAALYRLIPAQRPIQFDRVAADIDELAAKGALADAIDAAANLLGAPHALPREQQARLHERIAEYIHRQEAERDQRDPQNLKLLLEHAHAAELLGGGDTGRLRLLTAQAQEWLKAPESATDAYRGALQAAATPEQRRDALQALVRLLDGHEQHYSERREYLEQLLECTVTPPAYQVWALQQLARDELDAGQLDAAHELLERHGAALGTSDLRGYLEYLRAWLLLEEGQHAAADPLVRWVDEWSAANSRDANRADLVGHLPLLNGCLAGQIRLAENDPSAALDTFDAVLRQLGVQNGIPHAARDLYVDAMVGRARAQAALGEHPAARATLEETRRRLVDEFSDGELKTPRLRRLALVLFEDVYYQQEYEEAAAYLTFAVGLTPAPELGERPPAGRHSRLDMVERLAQVHQEAAAAAADPAARRRHAREAGAWFAQAADLAVLDEPRLATLLWSAAQQYDAGGARDAARRMLERFAEGRDQDPRVPKALLQLGENLAAAGEFESAVDVYQQLINRFPMLEEALRAKVGQAECLMALGGAATDRAELILTDVLEQERISAAAVAYRDALRVLCELLYERARWNDAIARLEAFAGLYPDDPDRLRTEFLLADCYRRSALALAAAPPEGADSTDVAAAVRERLEGAAGRFWDLSQKIEALPDAGEQERLYERLALFYRGDCLFALNDARALEDALATYRQITARYEGQPAALSAQVQIANVQLRLGRTAEAARAVERARWLLRNIPDRLFAESGGGESRADWEKYLSTLSGAPLFAGLIGGRPVATDERNGTQ